jgi:hypothetical protein
MNVTKHSSKNSLLKELKKQLDLGNTQVAITLEEDESDSSKNVYMLVVHGVKSEDQQSEQNS